MNYFEQISTYQMVWQIIFAVGKGLIYLLGMACMIKYLIGG